MSDDYSKHLEKRIKEMHERMAKSKLHGTKKRKYWIYRFERRYYWRGELIIQM